jgi:hypothetical protein
VNAHFVNPGEALEAAYRGRNAAFAMSLLIMIGGMWLVMNLGTLALARTRFRFLAGFLVALAVIAVGAGAQFLGGLAMEPAFEVEWSLGRWTHPRFNLYALVTFLLTVACFALNRRRVRA